MKTLRDELDVKFPIRAEGAKTSPRVAIRLFCLECMGGDAAGARSCETTECRLWPFGMAAHAQGLRSATGGSPRPGQPGPPRPITTGFTGQNRPGNGDDAGRRHP